MKQYEMTILLAVLLVIALIIYFATAKGEKRRVTLISQDGSSVPLEAEFANSTATRAKGLMGRASLGENEGMLFIFSQEGFYQFWMLNTSIPLEAIHVSENGTVVDIIEMDPCGLNITSCRLYSPRAPAKFVLEVNQNFSKRHGIVIGKSSMRFGQ
jgi:uncharacterized membrane protein (UPF0127 family)